LRDAERATEEEVEEEEEEAETEAEDGGVEEGVGLPEEDDSEFPISKGRCVFWTLYVLIGVCAIKLNS
jgi:hypothetical protein